MRHALTALATLATLPAAAQELIVYTYDSFTSEWGPGPVIEAAFEAECGCELTFVGTGDGAAMVARLQLEGAGTDADVVLGLDTNLTHAAAETGLFAPAPTDMPAPDLPVVWEDPTFVPFDWSYFAFIYDTTVLAEPPTSFESLAESDVSIVIQDPRSSTPGLGLLMWVDALYGEEAGAIWGELADNIVTVTPGWSEAYGLFLEGEADMVLSYTTSPAYHLIAEEDGTKAAAPFEAGHYMQVEVAGQLASTDQPELAEAFLRFIATPPFQSALPTTQWMYPAFPTPLPEGYETLHVPETALLLPAEEAAARRDAALALWREALSR
ncbi:thiamine ABC transporter substrate binding subunit [Pontivivens ytuae]|uniref:Thiamine-binding periplasmic protein n=1 Tax=Pontivivens ytuae TaxID=2789856 RepID=A0A7S9LNV1_9RHOB|nr:thiamine ABC transporter substrate binding subunit [Pontivivens ytuae]QPH52544.1 thiamine ABC transporter substrate binding subunit [Pontivivens ytuae]